MRTFARSCGPFSRTRTSLCGASSAQVIAANMPAAPPPTTTTRSLFERGIDAMDVLVIVERVQKLCDFLFGGCRHCNRVLRHITNFGGEDCPPDLFQRLGYRVEVLYVGEKAGSFDAFR